MAQIGDMGVEQSLQDLSVYSVFRLSRVPWVHRARGKVCYFSGMKLLGSCGWASESLSVELHVMERECILSQDHLEWSMLSMYCGVKHVV